MEQMGDIAANMQFNLCPTSVNKTDDFAMALFYKYIVSNRIDLRTDRVAHSDYITSGFNLCFGKILRRKLTFINKEICSIWINHQHHHKLLDTCKITCFCQRSFNPANNGYIAICPFRQQLCTTNSIQSPFRFINIRSLQISYILLVFNYEIQASWNPFRNELNLSSESTCFAVRIGDKTNHIDIKIVKRT